MKRILAAALLLVAAACAPANPTPLALNPVGVFAFTTAVNGSEVTGAVEVTGQPGAYGGRVRTSITPDMPITGVEVTEQQMVVSGSAPQGPLTIDMTFTGDTFTGTWQLGGDGGDLAGRRTP